MAKGKAKSTTSAASAGKKKGGLAGKIGLAVIVLVIAAGIVLGLQNFGKKSPAAEFQKGMGYATWSKSAYLAPGSDASMTQVREAGSEYISILVTWYQTTCWSGDIQRTGRTPSDESVIHAIRKAHELGMKVMLKLHLDLMDTTDGSWRGEIGCLKEPQWEEWFRKYTDYIMYYVDIANREKVEIICVGTELSTSASTKGYEWRELIKKVRAKYDGLLTYAAHWDRYLDLRFWDLLDFVGINAYFPLTEKMDPTYEELIENWQKWLEEIEEFQQKIDKPVIFPEAGCNSSDGAAIRPWEHAPRREVNLELQKNFYRALLETFWDKEWFYGLYWWYWGTNKSMGGKYNRSFTPQNKPAEKVIQEWYAKPISKPKIS